MAAPSRRESLGLASAFDLLDDVDLDSTMMMLEQADTPTAAARRRLSSVLRRGSLDQLELSLSSLAELFPESGAAHDGDLFSDDQLTTALGQMTNQASPSRRASGMVPRSARSSVATIKTEFPYPPTTLLSPTMDSFLHDAWADGGSELDTKTRRTSSKLLEGLGLLGHHSLLSPTGASLSVKLPTPRLSMQPLFPLSPVLPAPSSVGANAKANGKAKAKAKAKPRAPSQPRRAKQCVEPNCPRRAQSNNRCKTHGGGARCQVDGCDKSSQGGGLCRAHGGGKKCGVEGCTKGTQRLGLCYLHGGIRRCIQEGCKKKDRGNGFCISHGGGRRCVVSGCERSVRKGNACQTHQSESGETESPFKISRGHGLHP
jgi:hypothetical protein